MIAESRERGGGRRGRHDPERAAERHAAAVALGERIDQLAELVGGKAELSRLSHIREGQIYRYISTENTPGIDVIVDLARAGGVRVEWLATGQEPMLPTPPARVMERPYDRELEGFVHAEQPEEYVYFPRYDVQASAGVGFVVHSEQVVDMLAFRRDWLVKRLGVNPQQLVVIEAVGDSMLPTIESGDLLLVDAQEPQLRGNGIYVLRVGEALVVKRVQMKLDGSIMILSDNPVYPPEEVRARDLEELRIIGRVVWAGGTI